MIIYIKTRPSLLRLPQSVSSLIKGNHTQQCQRYVQPNTSYCLGVYLEDLQRSVPSSILDERVFSDMICLSMHFTIHEQIMSSSIYVNCGKCSSLYNRCHTFSAFPKRYIYIQCRAARGANSLQSKS